MPRNHRFDTSLDTDSLQQVSLLVTMRGSCVWFDQKIQERWQSGRMRLTRNQLIVRAVRGFESLSLRQFLTFQFSQKVV